MSDFSQMHTYSSIFSSNIAVRKIWRLSPTHVDIFPQLSDCEPLDISSDL